MNQLGTPLLELVLLCIFLFVEHQQHLREFTVRNTPGEWAHLPRGVQERVH